MKKVIVGLMVFMTAISPLFRGLFFAYEAWPFLTAFTLLSVMYLFIKLAYGESLHFNKWITAFGLLLILAYALSFINAANTRENISAIIKYTVYFILCSILYDYYCSKEKQFALIVMIPVVCSGFISAIIGVEALSRAFVALDVTLNDRYRRIGGTLQYANTSAIYFLICLIFSLTLMNITKKPMSRILFSGVGNTLLLAILLTGSRSGYVLCGLLLIIFVFFQPSKYKIKTLGNVLCTILPAFIIITRISGLSGSRDYVTLTKWLVLSFLVALILNAFWQILLRVTVRVNVKPGFMSLIVILVIAAVSLTFADIGAENLMPAYMIHRFSRLGFNNIRFTFLRDSLKLISKNWLIGLGGGGWTSLYHSVQEEFYTSRAVHNHYIEVLLESGILGFFSFTGLVIASLIFWVHSVAKSRDETQKTVILGFLCSFLSIIIHCSFDFDLNYVSIALTFWLLIAGSAIFRNAVAEGEKKSFSWKTLSKSVKLAGVIMCSAALSLGGIFSLASWHANKGLESVKSGNIAEARSHYEKAFSLDSLNARYTFELAKIYNYYAGNISDPEKSRLWRERAIQASEKSMALDRYYPAYREMAVRTFLDAGMPEKAFGRAEELVACQPCKDSNYELLARSYLEAGVVLMNNGEAERGRELLVKCTHIEDRPDPDASETIGGYRKMAAELLECRR